VRRLWIGGVCLLSAVLGFGFAALVWPGTPSKPTPGGRKGAVFRVQTNERVVALTFDDGPDPRWTPSVLQVLEQHRVHATFFLIGRNAEANPDLVHAELDAGYELGDHTWDHPDLETLPPHLVSSEISQGAQALRDLGAPSPKYFRPPKGLTDDVVGVIADANRYRTIFWDVCVERFVDHAPNVHEGVDDVLDHVRPGSIILAHDGGIPNRAKTLQALPLLLDGLKARGSKVVDVSQLLKAAKHLNR
jgi:peptidoglycan/xylan/chitin deacetylase (PgdA/CDA1 family)